ncbi:unannotated protein [freshwater metagenome]|uniref:Unannotated protein n=1 Tax=freshwater metagenome TaxID=449393 RepID=A0A6J6IPX7_9ZZZZ|nr:DUF3040 domain-containing protein [Actinomycetota bacterium]
MGLSEREQKLLEELERGLIESDSGFAAKVERVGNPASKLIAGILLSIIGLGVLVTGVFIQFAAIGVLGFLVMLAGLVVATSNLQLPQMPSGPKNSGSGPQGSGRNFFEDRWDKRQGGQ